MNRDRDTERQKQKLITMGKQKGFVTYDEVNDAHARGHRLLRSDRRLAVDARRRGHRGRRRGGAGRRQGPTSARAASRRSPRSSRKTAKRRRRRRREATAKKRTRRITTGYSKTNDPVRMYLRKMGSVSLLTREGEVEIAKRIEEGERRVLQVVLNSSDRRRGDPRARRSPEAAARSASRKSSATSTRKTPSSTRSGTSIASAS